jgi:peptidoglycan/LPS O-acetylase OafA/YrhL
MKHSHPVENLRGLAILCVVLAHEASVRDMPGVGRFVAFLLADTTSWFVFISGYLFHHTQRDRFSYPVYLRRKFGAIVLPYLLLSVVAIALGVALSRPQFLGLTVPSYIGWSLVVGGGMVGPMWFIPMITLVFGLSFLTIRLARTGWIHPVAFVAIAFTLFSERPFENLNPFLSLLHFAGFYLLGIVCSIHAPGIASLKGTRASRVLMAAGVALFALSAVGFFTFAPPAATFADGLGHLNFRQLGKLGLLATVFLLFQAFLDRPQPVLGYLARISFGLYFLHGFMTLIFQKVVQLTPVASSPWVFFAAETAFVLGLSVLLAEAMKFTLKSRSRHVIGY